jgi:hypothetical protein
MGAVRRIALAAAAFAVTMCGPVNADDYPSRPVKIIVPFGAGGPTDVYTRAIGEELRKSLHQPFVMDNRPGAGTTIGTDFVAKSPPDGYTLLMVSGTQTVNETLYAHKQYQLMRDLVPVAPLIDTDLVLVVHPSVQAKTLGELLALARSNPGAINYGSSGPGSNYHMAGELLKNLAGVDIVHVPYKGSTGARNDNCRSRRRRFQRDPLGRLHGAGGHAATDRGQAQSGDHQDRVPPGYQGGLGKDGCDADHNDANRFQGVYGWTGRQMGECHQGQPYPTHQLTRMRRVVQNR